MSSTDALAFTDKTHFSPAFGNTRPYRLFLPENYSETEDRYPVIYYMHGWGGSHINFTNKQERFNDNDVQRFCDEESVIFVMLNGQYGASHPYNVGEPDKAFLDRRSSGDNFWVAYQPQYKDYVLDLIKHIDSTLRTKTGREDRVIWGQSMGGFMSHFLSGKYPHLFGTAVMTAPSPRFFMGYPGRAVLYSTGPAYMNHRGVHVRFHNTTTGELHVMNEETHAYALREKHLNYTYKVYPGGHSGGTVLAAMEDALSWVSECLEAPLSRPERWHHADLYSTFDIWGYSVTSNLNNPGLDKQGYIVMRGVTEGGMSVQTRQWLPDGTVIPGVEIEVETEAHYLPETEYTLLKYNQTQDVKTTGVVTSDVEGRIHFSVNHELNHIGIFREGDPAEMVEAGYRTDGNSRFLRQGESVPVKFRVLNRGGQTASGVKVEINTDHPGVTLDASEISLGDIESGEIMWSEGDISVLADIPTPDAREPLSIRFNLVFTDENENRWEDELDVPVLYDLEVTDVYLIDDGVGYLNSMRLDSDRKARGTGNGNGIAEPGETIMLYVKDSGDNLRTRAYYEKNPYVTEKFFPDINMEPGTWIDGHFNTSLLEISEDCPKNYKLTVQLMYETNDLTNGDMPFVKELNWRKVILTINPAEEVSFWAETPYHEDSVWKYSGDGYDEPGIGWITDEHWPWIYTSGIKDSLSRPGWAYVWTDVGDRNGFYAYKATPGFWFYGMSNHGWYYSLESGMEGWKQFSL